MKKIFIEEKLMANDMSYDFKSNLEKSVIDQIRADEELMKEITEFCTEEYKEYASPTYKNTLQDHINLKIDEMASNAVDNLKMYVEFELEVFIQE